MTLDYRNKQCPIPVIETKKALEGLQAGATITIMVDNIIAIQNLQKMCSQLRHEYSYIHNGDNCYTVTITTNDITPTSLATDREDNMSITYEDYNQDVNDVSNVKSDYTIVLSSNTMGDGDTDLGHLLIKGFIYSITQLDNLPSSIVMYNSGVYLSTNNIDTVADLKQLQRRGVNIVSCGTCLNHYGLTEAIQVGDIVNMYDIASILTHTHKIIRP